MKAVHAVFLILVAMFCMVTHGYGLDVTKLKHPVKPFLWKVEGERLGDAVYLFGTAHFSDPRVVNLHPTAEKIFANSQRVYTESNLTDRGAAELRRYLTRDSKQTLTEALGSELASLADREIKNMSARRSLAELNDRKTWALWSTLAHLANCGDGRTQLDTHLSDRAYENSRTVIALESLEDQLGTLNKMSEKRQQSLVLGYLRQLKAAREKNVHPSQSIFNAYLKGDEASMIGSINSVTVSNRKLTDFEKQLKKGMIDDRNKRMAYKIEINALKYPKRSHFFAVGVTHYIGKNSIIDILRKKGYTITRIHK